MSDSESEPIADTVVDDTGLSALQENISRKGHNSYYYAHGKKIDGPQWDGKEEPRFLGTTASPQPTKILISTLESFSWLDETKHVKIYVEFTNAHEINDSDLVLTNDESSFSFTFSDSTGKPYSLNIGPLFGEIESTTLLKKSDKFVIKLKKKLESSWYQLKK